MEDTCLWNVSTDVNYTLKSAYRIRLDLLHSTADAINHFPWMNMWKLKTPHHFRSFLWRLAHQCFPTHINLKTGGIPCDDLCVMCESLAKTHMHLFFVCSKTMECWDHIGMGKQIFELLQEANRFTSMLFDFLSRLSLCQQQTIVMLCWSLWKKQNIKLWEASNTYSTFTVLRAKRHPS